MPYNTYWLQPTGPLHLRSIIQISSTHLCWTRQYLLVSLWWAALNVLSHVWYVSSNCAQLWGYCSTENVLHFSLLSPSVIMFGEYSIWSVTFRECSLSESRFRNAQCVKSQSGNPGTRWFRSSESYDPLIHIASSVTFGNYSVESHFENTEFVAIKKS